MQTEQFSFLKTLFQGLKRHTGALIATVSLCALVGGTLVYLLHPKYSDPGGWSAYYDDEWLTDQPHSSAWKEVPVLRYATSKEATKLLVALKSKPYVVLETKGHQKTLALRAVVDSLTLSPETPKVIHVFQNGESFWLVGNGTSRRDYIATKRPLIVTSRYKPKQVFVTLFSGEGPTKAR